MHAIGDDPIQSKRPTQRDVARLAGVSQATVSYVLNERSTVSVPVETRHRVLDAVRELGYIRNLAARSLRTNKTYTIASVFPDITNPFYPALERGIQDVARRIGYDLMIYNTDGIAEWERSCAGFVQALEVAISWRIRISSRCPDLLKRTATMVCKFYWIDRHGRTQSASNDLLALGALLAIRENVLSVPNDNALLDFDDIPIAKLINPSLTTVSQFQRQLGQRAAEMLFERLDGQLPATGRCEELPFELIMRDSA